MSDSPTDRLARVVELCERAVSGPWETTVNGDYVRQRDGVLIANVSPLHGDRCATSQAIAAAVNFIRDDAPALLAEVESKRILLADWKALADGWQARAEAAERVAREAEQDAARYRLLRSVTPYRFKKLQDACIADTGDTLYLLGDKLDAAIDAAILAHHGAGAGEGNDPQT